MFQSEVCSLNFQCVVLFAVCRVQRVFYYPHLGIALGSGVLHQSFHIPLERLETDIPQEGMQQFWVKFDLSGYCSVSPGSKFQLSNLIWELCLFEDLEKKDRLIN